MAARGGFRLAWAALTLALALHVADEAATDFLGQVWDPALDRLAARYPGLPLPRLGVAGAFGLLALAVVVLAALTPLAGPGAWGLVVAGRVYALVLLLNAAGHLALSAWLWRWTPGSTTSPLLIAGSIWLWRAMPSVRQARAWRRDQCANSQNSFSS